MLSNQNHHNYEWNVFLDARGIKGKAFQMNV